MRPEHIVVVPSTLAFLSRYAGMEDPVSDARKASIEAVSWLVERHPVELSVLAAPARPDNVARGVAEPPGRRIAGQLLSDAGFGGRVVDEAPGLLVVANGTATRSEKAPGHLDQRAAAYDRLVEDALRSGDTRTLRELDTLLGQELWAHDAGVLQQLGELADPSEAELDYAGDPYGVQYWVVRWTCAC